MRSPSLLACLFSVLIASFRQYASADIVVENDLINPEDIYDFIVLQDSKQWWLSSNTTMYFCIMRGLWNPENHPKKYPAMARMSNPVVYTSTKQYLPWLINRKVSLGVEKIAETGFADTFKTEALTAGKLVHDLQEGKGFFVDQEDAEKNYAYLPGVKITPDFPFLSGISSMMPSPDWFTGFYLLSVIDEYDRTYWNRILIHTYPWDAGTDAGDTYMSVDEDMDPQVNIERITARNAPGDGIFLSPDGRSVRPVAEWDCALHVCQYDEESCKPDNWPPENGCDILKYPGCEKECDPAVDDICEECKPKPQPIKLGQKLDEVKQNRQVFYRSCCQSNFEPLSGYKCAPGNPEKEAEEKRKRGGSSKRDIECSFWRPIACAKEKGKRSAAGQTSYFATIMVMGMGLVAVLL